MVVLKEPFLRWQSHYEGPLKSSWTHLIRKKRLSLHLHEVLTPHTNSEHS